MHPPLPLGAWRPFGAFLRLHRIPQKFLLYLAYLQPRRRRNTLILIGRPGSVRTVLSDRLVRIEAAKTPLLRRPGSRLLLRLFAKPVRYAVSRLRARGLHATTPEFAERDFGAGFDNEIKSGAGYMGHLNNLLTASPTEI
jgi:hypothetical protein